MSYIHLYRVLYQKKQPPHRISASLLRTLPRLLYTVQAVMQDLLIQHSAHPFVIPDFSHPVILLLTL